MSGLSVIIPFLNEAENLPSVLKKLDQLAPELNFPLEVIFVDDGSTDDSIPILRNSNPAHFTGRIIKLSRNFGSHAALRAGITKATMSRVTFLYADLQDPPELLNTMMSRMDEGNDIVWANRDNSSKSQGILGSLFSSIYNRLMKKYVNPDFPSEGFDIVMFNRKVVNELNKNMESNSSIFLQILNMGFRQSRVKYTKLERQQGKSKWTFSKKMKLFIDSFVAFSYFPIRLVSIVGIVFFLIGILWTIYILIRTFVFGDLNPGWPTLVSVLMIGFGITNIGLGIVAEYLWRTLDASRNRPVFIIDEIIDHNKEEE